MYRLSDYFAYHVPHIDPNEVSYLLDSAYASSASSFANHVPDIDANEVSYFTTNEGNTSTHYRANNRSTDK